MFNFLRSKKNYPNCNLCIWKDGENCSAQGGMTTRERYITKDCFKLYQTDGERKYIFSKDNNK